MITHELKCWPEFWEDLKNGNKPYEVRRNDRNFHVGDVCVFKQWSPEYGYVNDETVAFPISHMLYHERFPLGLQPGYVVLGFGVMKEAEDG